MRTASYPKAFDGIAIPDFTQIVVGPYPGCYEPVNDYVRETRPREPVVRFETPAGRQGQVDFGTFTLPWGRRHALLVVLGYPSARAQNACSRHEGSGRTNRTHAASIAVDERISRQTRLWNPGASIFR